MEFDTYISVPRPTHSCANANSNCMVWQETLNSTDTTHDTLGNRVYVYSERAMPTLTIRSKKAGPNRIG